MAKFKCIYFNDMTTSTLDATYIYIYIYGNISSPFFSISAPLVWKKKKKKKKRDGV
jgi:hypothetical protein